MNTAELTVEQLEALKEKAYRNGWEEGFQYAVSLMQRPINIPDSEVKDKITLVDQYLMHLEW